MTIERRNHHATKGMELSLKSTKGVHPKPTIAVASLVLLITGAVYWPVLHAETAVTFTFNFKPVMHLFPAHRTAEEASYF